MKIKKILTTFLIFILTLTPRILFIGTDAIYIDESNLIKGTKIFFNALFSGKWDRGSIPLQPGITTLFINRIVLEISEHFLNRELSILETYYYLKLSFAIISSLLVLLIYLLLTKLFNKKISIIASLLIALNPFLIAHSRIIGTDGLAGLFMIISILLFLIFIKTNKLYYVFISGLFGLLAISTKFSALVLIPFITLVIPIIIIFNFIFNLIKKNKVKLANFLKQFFSPILWLLPFFILIAFILIFFRPKIYELFLDEKFLKDLDYFINDRIIYYLTRPTPRIYLGKVRVEPLYSYYLVVLPFRLTPISLIFAPLTLILIMFKKSKVYTEEYLKYIICIIFYIILFIVAMSTLTYKGGRLILPVIVPINILSAISIYTLYTLFLNKFNLKDLISKNKHSYKNILSLLTSIKSFYILITVLVIIHIILCIPLFPHYLAYYNPLLGGAKQAAKMFNVGWGEGFYEAAQYLNKKENPEDISVSTWYDVCFQPYFKGKAFPTALAGENTRYILFYINQLQRNLFPELIEKYMTKYEPEYVVKINGLEYVSIYKTRVYKEVNFKNNKFILNLDAKNRKIFMKKGWYKPEDIGTWAGKDYSLISIDLIDKSNYEMELKIMPMPYLDIAQTVKVYVNDYQIGHVVLNKVDPEIPTFQFVKIRIPKGFISEKEPELFKFEYSNSLIPFDSGISEDKRDLSVLFENEIIFRKLD